MKKIFRCKRPYNMIATVYTKDEGILKIYLIHLNFKEDQVYLSDKVDVYNVVDSRRVFIKLVFMLFLKKQTGIFLLNSLHFDFYFLMLYLLPKYFL